MEETVFDEESAAGVLKLMKRNLEVEADRFMEMAQKAEDDSIAFPDEDMDADDFTERARGRVQSCNRWIDWIRTREEELEDSEDIEEALKSAEFEPEDTEKQSESKAIIQSQS